MKFESTDPLAVAQGAVSLRGVEPQDLEFFFAFQREPEGRAMLAFGPPDENDRAYFDANWVKHLANPEIRFYTILFSPSGPDSSVDERSQVAGHIVTFLRDGEPPREVGYSLGQAYWGKGIASAALQLVLDCTPERPLGARCASDNLASVRVLAKHGFREYDREENFANARGEQVEEVLLRLV